VVTAFLGWALATVDVMPVPLLVLLIAGLFFLSFATLGLVIPHVISHIPVPADNRVSPTAGIQKIRLIRNEIDEGARIVERAVGVDQVYELVGDAYWVGHRNELAAVPEAGAAHRLAGRAWEGFRRYNTAVKDRAYISNSDLEQIVADARRAVDALNVAADDLRAR
jgi:hypothetical protein